MNNYKKIAITALGGCLAVTSANAVDVTASGASEAGYSWSSGGNSGSASNVFGAQTNVAFKASGELDNGWTVSTVYGAKGSWALSSSNVSIDTGSLGTFRINRLGAAATNGNDDILPTAWEEANDSASHSVAGMPVADALTSGSLAYISPAIDLAGASITVYADYDPAANVAGANVGATPAKASATGSGTGFGFKATMAGLTIAGAHVTVESEKVTASGADGSDEQNAMGQIIYNAGPFSIGYGEWDKNAKDGANDYSAVGMSIAFNVNDDLSVSYGEIEDSKDSKSGSTAVDAEIKSIQAAYTMGSIAVKVKRVESDNVNFVTGKSQENSEISLSFTF